MSECLITRRGGKQIIWKPLTFITASGTYIVPHNGKYRVACVASGGNGYNAGYGLNRTSSHGSGGGGIAESILSLTKDESITITIDFSVTSFGNYMTATAGQSGTNTGNGIGGSGSAVGLKPLILNGTDGKAWVWESGDTPNYNYINGNANSEHRLGGTLSGIVYISDFGGVSSNVCVNNSKINPPSTYSPYGYYPSGYVVCAEQNGNSSSENYASGVVFIEEQEE